MTNEAAAIAYHNATKHHFNRYARSLGYLDWATQPNPFRRYEGAQCIPLPLLKTDTTQPFESLYGHGGVETRALDVEAVGLLFECSLALSAWKQFQGERWALRCNPSSGNLHPTEGYLVSGPLPGLSESPAVYHYAPAEHALELRTVFGSETWQKLAQGFSEDVCFVGISSVHWREAWKYGERAYRYCQHDVGHAVAAVRFAVAILGRRAVHLEGMSDAGVAALLGLDRDTDFEGAEREHPDLLMAVFPGDEAVPHTLPGESIHTISQGVWHGRANRLSDDHVEWKAIEDAAQACAKPATEPSPWVAPALPALDLRPSGASAHGIIRQRRSAVAMDGETAITAEAFYRMLSMTMPRQRCAPWDALVGAPRIHLGLFVHRVTGLQPGIYFLARDAGAVTALRAAMKGDFVWQAPQGCPAGLPLHLLKACDCRAMATTVSCGQDIAGDGAFSLGMIAEFEGSIERLGAWYYRRLFWEAGAVGQVLYLEAEAAGVRATGIGCYFDDPVHEVFGLVGQAYQSLYHFTVGGPVDDTRLMTLPPYPPERSG
ncbi:MAG: SagB/ThcOx family dehydrogenase [Candidatus Hydrogenedentales bacterium]